MPGRALRLAAKPIYSLGDTHISMRAFYANRLATPPQPHGYRSRSSMMRHAEDDSKGSKCAQTSLISSFAPGRARDSARASSARTSRGVASTQDDNAGLPLFRLSFR